MSGGLVDRNRPDIAEETRRDAESFGLAPEAIARLAARPDAGGGVWPDNVQIVRAFLAVETQWRTAVAGGMESSRILFVGLDYTAVRAGLDAVGIEITPDLWSGLQVMEGDARAAMNGRSA